MKKLLAVLLALVLALSCTVALAETAAAPGFEGVTIESEYDVDRDTLKSVLTQLGLDEATLAIVDTVAAVIDQTGEKMVLANDGVQAELLLKGTSLVNLVALVSDSDVTIGSNLVPNHALSISMEEIGKALADLTQETEIQDLDLSALLNAATPHITSFIEACSGAIASGDPVQGDYEVNGGRYNMMVPLNIDVKTIVEALNKLAEDLQGDEAVMAALQQMGALGVDVDTTSSEPIDTANVPDVKVEVYMTVNENGEQSDATLVVVDVTPAGQTDPATTVYVTTEGSNVYVDAQFISADTTLSLTAEPDPSDPMGVSCRLDLDVGGFYAGLATVTASNGDSIEFNGYLYVLDDQNPIASEQGTITMSGALTLGVADGATVLTLADLTGEKAEESVTSLGMDLLLNGLGSVLSTATQLMPDEIGAITSSVMGGADDEPAA